MAWELVGQEAETEIPAEGTPAWEAFANLRGPQGEQGPPGVDGAVIGGASPAYVDDSIAAHVNAPTPHPAYDDMPDLVLLFENGLL